jgi:hypothetical protein
VKEVVDLFFWLSINSEEHCCQLCRTSQCKELQAKLKIYVDMGCGHLEVNSRRSDFHILVHTTLSVRIGILYLFIDAMLYKGIYYHCLL